MLEEAKALGWHLKEEGEKLTSSWAVVEAAWPSPSQMLSGASAMQFRNFELGSAYQDVASASLRDSMLTTLRLTDPEKPLTLFRAFEFVQNQEFVRELENEYGNANFERSVRFVEEYVGKFDKNMRARNWRESEQESLRERPYNLMKCRAELKRFRDARIVHCDDPAHLGGLHIPYLRVATVLTALATEAAFSIFTGHRWRSIHELWRKINAQRKLRRSLSSDYFHQSLPLGQYRLAETSQ